MQTLTPDEREELLDEAADKYMSGEISIEDLDEAEQRYMTDYRIALQAFAQYLRQPPRKSAFQRLLDLLMGGGSDERLIRRPTREHAA